MSVPVLVRVPPGARVIGDPVDAYLGWTRDDRSDDPEAAGKGRVGGEGRQQRVILSPVEGATGADGICTILEIIFD